MIRKLSFLLLLLACELSFAAPLTTPHTFSAGTPAKSADVNANFKAHENAINDIALRKPTIIFKMNGADVGFVLEESSINTRLIQTTKSALIRVSASESTVSSLPFDIAMDTEAGGVYTSANCTGQPYMLEGGTGGQPTEAQYTYGMNAALANQRMMLFASSKNGALYYTQAVAPVSLTFNSYIAGTTCVPSSFGIRTARPLLPNNPDITGMPQLEDGYLKNVTFEIR